MKNMFINSNDSDYIPDSEAEASAQISDDGDFTVCTDNKRIHCVSIIGQIEGHDVLPPNAKTTKYEHLIPQIIAADEDPSVEGIMIVLNTVGGDIEAGLAISELISGTKKPSASVVLGGGHSIGVPLAVAADKSFIVPSATMTVHPVRMNGVVLGTAQTFSYFKRMQERIVNFVSKNSNISPERFRELMLSTEELVMDVGSVLDGEAAVKEGLIDAVGNFNDALDFLNRAIKTNT